VNVLLVDVAMMLLGGSLRSASPLHDAQRE
jgi:hypothetical protein